MNLPAALLTYTVIASLAAAVARRGGNTCAGGTVTSPFALIGALVLGALL